MSAVRERDVRLDIGRLSKRKVHAALGNADALVKRSCRCSAIPRQILPPVRNLPSFLIDAASCITRYTAARFGECSIAVRKCSKLADNSTSTLELKTEE